MEGWISWIKNITFYLIFISVVSALLPNKKYEKYMKLFAGLILILLMLQPLTSGLHVEDRLARYFEDITFQKEVSELYVEAGQMEALRLERMMRQYETAISHDISLMAAGLELEVADISVEMETDPDQEHFGAVKRIRLRVSRQQDESAAQQIKVEVEVEQIEPISLEQTKQPSEKIMWDASVNRLRKQIGEYYNLEEEQIEIQWQDQREME